MRLPIVRTAASVLALALLPVVCPAQDGGKPPIDRSNWGWRPSSFEEALARYEETQNRRAFAYHTEGRHRLEQVPTAAGLALLAKDYTTAKLFPEESRYTIATMLGRSFNRAEFAAALTELRVANAKPVDAWLWVQTLCVQADHDGVDAVLALAIEGKTALQRATAIAAIGASRKGDVKAVVVPTCAQFPPKDKEADRMLLLGAMSGALFERKSAVNTPEYRDALRAYIGLLGDDVGLSHTAKVQMARHLQWILRGPALFVNPEPWLELLERGDVKKPGPSHTVVAPRFFGVETDGERLCYVVDMSDSMCKKIAPSSKPSGPTTGPKVKKKRELLDESDIPWHKVDTRWDLAREHLRIALLRLTPDKHFSVVWFGTESGTLDSCKGMIKATKANVDRVIAELDSIRTRMPKELSPDEARDAPDGKLRGTTNMHSGLRRAYGLAGKGFVASVAYVDPETLTEGCDTIFLLSDGAPSFDDFEGNDKDYGEGKVIRDQEYKAEAPRAPRLDYPGPYVIDDWLVTDVERMNAFRRIRLHCIGLGEANMDLLNRLGAVGHGEVFAFGDKKNGTSPGSGPDKE